MMDSLDHQRARLIHHTEALLSVPVDDLVPSPRTVGYRARIELTPGPDGILGYRGRRSHEAVPVPECTIARPEINQILEQIPSAPKVLQRLALRSNGSSVVIHAQCKDRHRGPVRRWLEELPELGVPLALNGRGVRGDPTTVLSVGGVEHRLSPSTFYQVNLEINESLVNQVVDWVEASDPTAVLDLFAGAGNLSLPLAARGIPTTLIEAHPTAIKDARRTAARLNLKADARERKAEDYQAGDAFFDVAILDPPRRGAGAVIDQVLLTRPRAVILVSCSTSAMASDLKRAATHGYRLSRLKLFEMFPHTGHVEALGLLSST